MMRMTKLSVVGATQFSLKYLEIDAGVNLYLKISMAHGWYSLQSALRGLCPFLVCGRNRGSCINILPSHNRRLTL